MAKYISNELARLIRKRAYTKGTLSWLDREESKSIADFVQLRQTIRNLREKKRQTVAQLSVLDAEIARQADIDPDEIRGIRPTPHSGSRLGAIVRTIVRVLKDSPIPVATPDIVAVLVTELGWPYQTIEEREMARRKVVQPLRVLVKKGAVERLHDTTKNKIGLWQWVGL